jgi:hypothetical protein
LLCCLAFVAPSTSQALEALDGRVQVHGFGEMQLRALAKGFSTHDGWDLAQWYNVLNVELELDIAPDGWGPFGIVSGFVRGEARYDCVWTGGCEMLPSVNTYGIQARRMPKRFSDGQRNAFVGVIEPTKIDAGDGTTLDLKDTRRIVQTPLGQGSSLFAPFGPYAREVPGEGKLARIWNVPGLGQLLFALPSQDPAGFARDGTPNTDLGRSDNDLALHAGSYIGSDFLDYRFGVKRVKGVTGGQGTVALGPWRPIDRVVAYGALANRPNPYVRVVTLPLEYDPVTGMPDTVFGLGELSFRAASPKNFNEPFDRREAQGIYYPHAALQRFFDEGADIYDQNFSQTDLAWNHGASQSDDRELKEAYLDIDVLDGVLWGRFGRQVIVWGKTELFRTVDQFNPQDLGLASLPSLEESRIPLWSARLIYSLGDVGPLQDVRIEGAVLFDQYEPNDLGRCGEPYSPVVTCALSSGYLAHALVGTGLAGEVRPSDPWDDIDGLEGGVRIEWRSGRFSFALSDYYGFDDLPYVDPVHVYERNVDPETGRPRRAGSRGSCTTGAEPACLGVMPYRFVGPFGTRPLTPENREDLLANHHANQQLFATICATTVGQDLSPRSCAFNIWNNPSAASDIPGAPPFTSAFTTLLSGGVNLILPSIANARTIMRAIGRFQGVPLSAMPVVTLERTPADGGQNTFADYVTHGVAFDNDLFRNSGLAPYLNDEQEALLGCGRFWDNPCEVLGFDLSNTEASAFFQSWPGFEGTEGTDWDTFVGTQPGTLDFEGGPTCTRYENGTSYVLPGCGPDDTMLQHPFFGTERNGCLPACLDADNQYFVSELAAVSFNALMTFVVTSVPPDRIDNVTGDPDPDRLSDRAPYFNEFDWEQAYRQDGCSFRKPFLCRNVAAFLSLSGTQRNTLRAGGNATYGRRDFVWHSGSVVGLRRNKRNVLGFAFDFAEDITKTAWAFELSWFEGTKVADFDEADGLRTVDQFNLVLSVDRSTFINFLNANRTFFINGQLFLRYIPQHRDSMALNGPVNVLSTLTIFTGYWQDRLNPALTLVRDFQSKSGAILTGLTYRYSERMSITVGGAWFYGRTESRPFPLTPAGIANAGAGKGSYRSYVQNGLSLVRERDEVFLRLRYTF